jgi:hypothetical protein
MAIDIQIDYEVIINDPIWTEIPITTLGACPIFYC